MAGFRLTNMGSINGMRRLCLSSYEDKYIFVARYHDEPQYCRLIVATAIRGNVEEFMQGELGIARGTSGTYLYCEMTQG